MGPPACFKYQPAVLPGLKVMAFALYTCPSESTKVRLLGHGDYIPGAQLDVIGRVLPIRDIRRDVNDQSPGHRLAAKVGDGLLLLLLRSLQNRRLVLPGSVRRDADRSGRRLQPVNQLLPSAFLDLPDLLAFQNDSRQRYAVERKPPTRFRNTLSFSPSLMP